MGLKITNTSIDAPTLDALFCLPDRGIELRNVRLPTLSFKMRIDLRTAGDVDASFIPGVSAALAYGGNPTISDAHRLVGLFRCERLYIDLVASEKDVDSLWEFSCLKQVQVRNPEDNKWTEHARKDDSTQ